MIRPFGCLSQGLILKDFGVLSPCPGGIGISSEDLKEAGCAP